MAEVQNGPSPTDSSSTNRLKYANTGDHGNGKKQEVVMMSLCVLSSSPACGCESLGVLFFSEDMGCVCRQSMLSHTKKCMRAASGWCPGADTATDITSVAILAITIWHLHLLHIRSKVIQDLMTL